MDSLATKPYHQTEGKVCKGIASHTDCFVMCDCVIVKIIGPPCVYFIFSSIKYHFSRKYQCSLCVSIPFIGRFIVLTPSPPAICHYLLLLLLCPHIIHLSLCFSSPSVFRSPNIFFILWIPVQGLKDYAMYKFSECVLFRAGISSSTLDLIEFY